MALTFYRSQSARPLYWARLDGELVAVIEQRASGSVQSDAGEGAAMTQETEGGNGGLVPARMTGRCANGFERGAGRVVHLVEAEQLRSPDFRRALCGARPGRLSAGWHAEPEAPLARACRRCLDRWARREDLGRERSPGINRVDSRKGAPWILRSVPDGAAPEVSFRTFEQAKACLREMLATAQRNVAAEAL